MEDLLPGALGAEDILRDAIKYSSLNEGKKYDHLWCFSLQPVWCKEVACRVGAAVNFYTATH